MNSGFTLDYTPCQKWVSQSQLSAVQDQINDAYQKLKTKSGEGSDFLGWFNPRDIAPENLIVDIKETARIVNDKYEITEINRSKNVVKKTTVFFSSLYCTSIPISNTVIISKAGNKTFKNLNDWFKKYSLFIILTEL